jgi:predicted RNA-binding Zn-ribbon protein involved in translation (DUF1610 family)
MELREIELILIKLQKVGTAACESCNKQVKFSDVEVFGGSYLCPDCMRKVIWAKNDIIELPS